MWWTRRPTSRTPPRPSPRPRRSTTPPAAWPTTPSWPRPRSTNRCWNAWWTPAATGADPTRRKRCGGQCGPTAARSRPLRSSPKPPPVPPQSELRDVGREHHHRERQRPSLREPHLGVTPRCRAGRRGGGPLRRPLGAPWSLMPVSGPQRLGDVPGAGGELQVEVDLGIGEVVGQQLPDPPQPVFEGAATDGQRLGRGVVVATAIEISAQGGYQLGALVGVVVDERAEPVAHEALHDR